jgi:hypothetical protein
MEMATVTDPLFVLVMLSFAAGIVVGWVANNIHREGGRRRPNAPRWMTATEYLDKVKADQRRSAALQRVREPAASSSEGNPHG